MKLWEVLKVENVGREYKDNNEIIYKLKVIKNNEPMLYKGNDIVTFTQYEMMNLDFEEIVPKSTGWNRVSVGETYYYIDNVKDKIDDCYEENDISDEILYGSCNYFSTKEKAKEVAREQLLYRKIKKFYDENDGEVKWSYSNTQAKYSIYYHYYENRWGIAKSYFERDINTVYFSSEELAKRCIDEVITLL